MLSHTVIVFRPASKEVAVSSSSSWERRVQHVGYRAIGNSQLQKLEHFILGQRLIPVSESQGRVET